MWAELQHQDSEIAEYVLKHMKANRLLVPPVHHSFVVQDQYIHNLYSIMKEAYRMLVGHSIPEVKLKMGANTDLTQPSFLELDRLITEEKIRQEEELEGIKTL